MSTLTGLVSGGGKPNRVTVYTSGSGTFTPLNASNSFLRVTLTGGGKGGFAGDQYNGGVGGDAGHTVQVTFKASSPSYSYAVGAGGAGANGASNPGAVGSSANGGNTTLGSFIGIGGGHQYYVIHPAADQYFRGGPGGPGGYAGSPGPGAQATNGIPGVYADGFVQSPISPFPSFTRRITPSNAGTATNAYPSFPYRAGGGGGGSSIYGDGGTGGSVQSPFALSVLAGSNGPAWGAGGGGGGVTTDGFTPGPDPQNPYLGRTLVYKYGAGGNGNSGIIIIEEYVY